MGGTKKKPISSMEKMQAQQQEEAKGAPKKKQPKGAPQKAEARIDTKVEEKQLHSTLASLKAVTIYGLARALGLRASAANALLHSLEARGVLAKVGGYSGHYVYQYVSKGPSGARASTG